MKSEFPPMRNLYLSRMQGFRLWTAGKAPLPDALDFGQTREIFTKKLALAPGIQ